MVFDHTWMMKKERTIKNIMMGRTMKEAGIGGSFITSERHGNSKLRPKKPSSTWSQSAHGNNTVLLYVPVLVKEMRHKYMLPLLDAWTYSTADLGRRRLFYALLALGDLGLSGHAVNDAHIHMNSPHPLRQFCRHNSRRASPVSEDPNGDRDGFHRCHIALGFSSRRRHTVHYVWRQT
jgi:hypothetical protein